MQEVTKINVRECRFENSDLVDWFLAIDACLA
jgi:hypothetical protein